MRMLPVTRQAGSQLHFSEESQKLSPCPVPSRWAEIKLSRSPGLCPVVLLLASFSLDMNACEDLALGAAEGQSI